MLYDVTILTIRPGGTPKSLALLNDWIGSRNEPGGVAIPTRPLRGRPPLSKGR